MSKNVFVNGEAYSGVSTLELLLVEGGTALFKDIDEAASGGSAVLEMATGTFTVEAVATNSPVINHGMAVKPDVAVVVPVHWHDTTDNNLAICTCSQVAYAASGRRAVDGGTSFYSGGIDATKITDTTLTFTGGAYAKFQPTYTNAAGETAQQVYKWIAFKFKE